MAPLAPSAYATASIVHLGICGGKSPKKKQAQQALKSESACLEPWLKQTPENGQYWVPTEASQNDPGNPHLCGEWHKSGRFNKI